MASSSMSRRCFHCKALTETFYVGWQLRNGGFAMLCQPCGRNHLPCFSTCLESIKVMFFGGAVCPPFVNSAFTFFLLHDMFEEQAEEEIVKKSWCLLLFSVFTH
ncbi:hypothetical protein V6N13_049716 [Hibiscus sabdariffa]|uniref:Uncharacterized protein n=1 Tax=Hibiscus sabdariffa TaxID=183260 RepID=A0ABR2QWC2_9ROSI